MKNYLKDKEISLVKYVLENIRDEATRTIRSIDNFPSDVFSPDVINDHLADIKNDILTIEEIIGTEPERYREEHPLPSCNCLSRVCYCGGDMYGVNMTTTLGPVIKELTKLEGYVEEIEQENKCLRTRIKEGLVTNGFG